VSEFVKGKDDPDGVITREVMRMEGVMEAVSKG
jgi:hypothetical protein